MLCEGCANDRHDHCTRYECACDCDGPGGLSLDLEPLDWSPADAEEEPPEDAGGRGA